MWGDSSICSEKKCGAVVFVTPQSGVTESNDPFWKPLKARLKWRWLGNIVCLEAWLPVWLFFYRHCDHFSDYRLARRDNLTSCLAHTGTVSHWVLLLFIKINFKKPQIIPCTETAIIAVINGSITNTYNLWRLIAEKSMKGLLSLLHRERSPLINVANPVFSHWNIELAIKP